MAPSEGAPAQDRLGKAVRAVRLTAGVAALPSATGLGLASGLVRGTKRDGIDAALPRWLDWHMAAAGVSVRVTTGARHLRSPRPAVFIFNHKNYWDAFCLMSLVRTRFTGVGKKELEESRLLAPVVRLLDIALVDRSGALSAKEQLADVEERARQGLSILIAPEGTRSKTGELGPFKKGPFRIAMASGLPVIPVVFRNAEILGDHRSKLMGSGRVDAAVLDPVDPSSWALDDLAKHIDEVRDAYVETLAHWPYGEYSRHR